MQDATENGHEWRRAIRVTAVVFAIFLLQHYFRRFGKPLGTIYFTILFDSVALTGLAMIALSYLIGPLARLWPARWTRHLTVRKQLGLIGLVFVVVHVFLALAVFTPAYYPKFFAPTGKLSAAGEFSVLAGAIGLVILLIIAVTSLPSVAEKMTQRSWLAVQRLGSTVVILSTLHFAIFKWRGWFDINHWNNYIPPGTLVVTVFVLFVFAVRLLAEAFGRNRTQNI